MRILLQNFSMRMLFGIILFQLSLATIAKADDRLVIISPHRKSIQQEYIPKFEQLYETQYKTKVKVEWIDQGGTSDDLRFVQAKFKANPKSAGVDLFWGGGTLAFLELEKDGSLEKYTLPKELDADLPATASGVAMRSAQSNWYASAVSTFGIFYNVKTLKMEKLEIPKTWEELTRPQFRGLISLTDPRRSGGAAAMMQIILAAYGWEKGWQVLTEIAANTRTFTHSSSDPIKAVVSGDAALAMTIDFYAYGKMADLGADKVNFVLPAGQTVLDPDPIGILKGAPNRKVAERFVDFVLGSAGQKLMMLPLGAADGPKQSALARISVNRRALNETKGTRMIDFDPFAQKSFLKFDFQTAAESMSVLNDLVGAMLIDHHQELKKAWESVIKGGSSETKRKELAQVPIMEKDFRALAKVWDNEVERNKKINEWVTFAREKYKKF